MKIRISFFLMFMLIIGSLTAQINYFNEPFNNNKNNWPFLGKYDGYSLAIQNGHLRIESTSSASIQTFIEIKMDKGDYGMSTKMILESGKADGLIGIRFGMDNDGKNFYSFMYSNEGFVGVYQKTKKYKNLFGAKIEGAVKPFEYNNLTVKKEGVQYVFEVNGKEVYRTKLKKTFGDFFAIKTSPNTTVLVDEINFYDPKATKSIIDKALEKAFEGLPKSGKKKK